MSDRLKLIRSYKSKSSKGIETLLASIVNTKGSTYRNSGAKMLIFETGESTGLLSGGCIENEIIRHSKKVFKNRKPKLLTFDTTKETDIVFGFGVGCEGQTEILLELIPENCSDEVLFNMLGNPHTDEDQSIGLVYKSTSKESKRLGQRLQVKNNTISIGNLELKIEGSNTHIPQEISLGNEKVKISVEKRPPLPRINIIGAGPDTLPVYKFATQLGWSVNIIDHRPQFLKREDFPNATSLLNCRPDDILKNIIPKKHDYFVIMTHNFLLDLEYLQLLLPLKLQYIGLLGSRKRRNLLIQKLYETTPTLKECSLDNFHAPIGINLTEKTPDIIALSIVTEIQMIISSSVNLEKYKTIIKPLSKGQQNEL